MRRLGVLLAPACGFARPSFARPSFAQEDLTREEAQRVAAKWTRDPVEAVIADLERSIEALFEDGWSSEEVAEMRRELDAEIGKLRDEGIGALDSPLDAKRWRREHLPFPEEVEADPELTGAKQPPEKGRTKDRDSRGASRRDRE